MRSAKLLGLLALLACTAATTAGAAENPPLAVRAPANLPVAHIAVIVMENRPQTAIMGNPNAAYLNSLAAAYTYLDNYSAVSHPSLPNYLALIGGDTFGITQNCERCYLPARNLSDLLFEAGISSKAYLEDMPRACFSGSTRTYAQKHNPFAYFDSVRNDPERCQTIVPYSQLAADAASDQLPSFIWITPNLCHDMHDCGVAAGDRWLAENVPQLLNSAAFTLKPSLLAITWDEDDGSAGNRVPLILAGSRVKRGYVSHTPANHYTLLRTIETAWGLPQLTANDAAAQPLTDIFQD